MSYAEKLRDPRWQKKRLQILERDSWACRCCQSTTRNLQVHHLYYAKRDPWDYPDHVYQTLCEDCHSERQAIVDLGVEQMRTRFGDIPTEALSGLIRRLILSVGLEADKAHAPVTPEVAKEYFRKMREVK